MSEHPPSVDAQDAAPARRAPGKALALWGSALLALSFFAQGYSAMRRQSLTWDEPLYIASGCTYLVRHDFRLTPEAPPLSQELCALAVLTLHPELPGADHPAWQEANHVLYAQEFVRLNAERLPELAFRARLPSLALGALLVLAIGLFAGRLYGALPGLVAAAAAALSPNLLAHAQLATTDLGCAAFMLFAVWSFQWATRTGGTLRFLACGAITGLALSTKFTALLLGPVYLGLALALLVRRRLAPMPLARGLLIVFATAFIVVGAGYGFSFDGSLYLRGLAQVWAAGRPGYLFYLFGDLSTEPFWYYGLAAFLVKVPLPTLCLLALAFAGLAVERARLEPALFVLVPAAAVVGASFFDRANIGLRHLLPAFPFLLAFTAQALAGARHRALRGILCAALLLWLAVDAARIHPHHLSYFNEAVGGPANGPYLLDDSNIDWGQDLPALADWQRAHQGEPLAVLYFGNVPPEAYGVHGEPPSDRDILSPRPGTYAISVHHLVGFRRLRATTGLDVDWLTRFRPVARAGWSIYIYRFE